MFRNSKNLFFISMTSVNSLKGHKNYQQKSKTEELKGTGSKGLGISLISIPEIPVFSESGLSKYVLFRIMYIFN